MYLLQCFKSLKPGITYLFVEHPGDESEEMQALGNKYRKNVARDRHWVTEVFTSELVMKTIKEKGIELINYTKVGTLPVNREELTRINVKLSIR
jgi:hypothetical protein